MGIDCKVLLPTDVRARDVAKAMAILLGADKTKHPPGKSGSWVCQTDAKVEANTAVPTCADLVVLGDRYLYHFEVQGGQRLLMRRARAKTIALFCRLAQFFGGAVDFNDCDDQYDRFYERPIHRPVNDPEDGLMWNQLQEDLFNLEPLADEDVAKYAEYAAYKE